MIIKLFNIIILIQVRKIIILTTWQLITVVKIISDIKLTKIFNFSFIWWRWSFTMPLWLSRFVLPVQSPDQTSASTEPWLRKFLGGNSSGSRGSHDHLANSCWGPTWRYKEPLTKNDDNFKKRWQKSEWLKSQRWRWHQS